MLLSPAVPTAVVSLKVVVLLLSIHFCCCFNCAAVVVLSFPYCVDAFCRLWSSDHLMHVRRWLLDSGCTIVTVNVFVHCTLVS